VTLPARDQVFRGFWAVATVAVAGFIFYQSTREAGDPTVPALTTAWTYVGHVAVYAGLGFCAQTATLSRRLHALVAVVAGGALLGAGIEAYQSTLEGRTGSAYDALANLAGMALGAAAALWLTPWWERWLAREGT
jgi:VanZ family protein